MSESLFPRMSLVRHKKTRGLYRIMIDASYGRIEATNEPAYGYVSWLPATLENIVLWIRPQSEMEDGRFELMPEEPETIP